MLAPGVVTELATGLLFSSRTLLLTRACGTALRTRADGTATGEASGPGEGEHFSGLARGTAGLVARNILGEGLSLLSRGK